MDSNGMLQLLGLIGTFAAAVALCAIWIRISTRLAILDVPNRRSSHVVPTPRGGGVAIILAYVATPIALGGTDALGASLLWPLLTGSLLVGLVGLADDYRSVPPGWRLLAHFLAAGAAVAAIGTPPLLPDDTAWPALRWMLIAASVVAIVWHVNLFNFMDGIDGIAGTQAVFVTGAAGGLLWLSGHEATAYACLGLAAAAAGFLVWNRPPAKLFMGDAGSGFLGFAIAVLALYSVAESMLPLSTWLILLSAFVVDATVTLLRRLARGERVSQAHRSHAYQWMARRLDSHARVTTGLLLVDLLWLLPWAVASAVREDCAAVCVALATLPLVVLALLLGSGKREAVAGQ